MTIQLRSEAFADGQPIPQKYTADGADLSPPLEWDKLPAGTRELALICDDPDAPFGTWVHWVLFKIPADVHKLPAGLATRETLEMPAGARQGKNSFSSGSTIGYQGPAPPGHALHHYHFKLYALDGPVDLAPGADKAKLLAAIAKHIIAQGELVGTYHR